MARKKKLRPPPDVETVISSPPDTESTEDRIKRQIVTMQSVMETVLDLRYAPVTPGQLRDAAEMFLCQMHLKKVKPEWYIQHAPTAISLITLCSRIQAEAALFSYELPEPVKKLVHAAMAGSEKDINEVRVTMLADVKLLGHIPLPGTILH